MQLSFPKNERTLVFLLLAVYLLIRFPLLNFLPLVKDEGLYAVMSEEQAIAPTTIPAFLGYPVSWKPAPFFWLHSLMSDLPLPMEVAYRLPSFLCGLLTVPILFRLFRNIGASPNVSFFSTLVFLLSMASIYPDAAFLTDAMNFLFISASLLLYTEKGLGRWRFLAAGALAFCAFFVKLVIGFMVPLLAVAFFFSRDRKILKDPLFLFSLLAVPAAFLLHYSILDSAGLAKQLYESDIGGHMMSSEGLGDQMTTVIGSVSIFFLGAGLWFALSLFGFWKNWRADPFMAFWFAMTLFPILTGNFMIWYYLPVMPAIAYFCTSILINWEGRERIDAFFWIFFCLISLVSLGIVSYYYVSLYETYQPEREAGLLLAGKDDVCIIGNWMPGVAAYKVLTEMREGGGAKDFGWVTASRWMNASEVQSYLADYHSEPTDDITEGSFTGFFSKKGAFRKPTGISHFRYIAITGNFSADIPNSTLVYNESFIQIFEVD
ncbi:MAG: glycosyltransferase family 39 protein [Candidatus Micrarchaeota archaeon]